MKLGLRRLVVTIALLALAAGSAFAQGASTTSISGTVTDSGGGVIPGATVIVTNDSGTSFTAVSNAEGAFTVPALQPGAYKVTVALQGFKTWASDVRVAPNAPGVVKAVLEVGTLTETVTVSSSSELINTQTATVAVDAERRPAQPHADGDAQRAERGDVPARRQHRRRQPRLDDQRPARVDDQHHARRRQQQRQLPAIDGRFFASVTPRQDAVEAVTVTTAVGGANVGGSGAVRSTSRPARAPTASAAAPTSTSATRRSTRTTGSTSATACRRTTSS